MCAIVCFNVSILGKYYIYMYYSVLPNKLTHSLTYLSLNYDLPISPISSSNLFAGNMQVCDMCISIIGVFKTGRFKITDWWTRVPEAEEYL